MFRIARFEQFRFAIQCFAFYCVSCFSVLRLCVSRFNLRFSDLRFAFRLAPTGLFDKGYVFLQIFAIIVLNFECYICWSTSSTIPACVSKLDLFLKHVSAIRVFKSTVLKLCVSTFCVSRFNCVLRFALILMFAFCVLQFNRRVSLPVHAVARFDCETGFAI